MFLEPIPCKGCGKLFQPKRRESKVCSAQCVKAVISSVQQKYSEEEFQAAIELRLQGKTRTEIAKITHIKIPSLTALFRKRGIGLTDEQKGVAVRRRWADHRPIVDGKKFCAGCKTMVPVDRFAVDRGAYSGLGSRCKQCQHVRYIENAESVKARVRGYKVNNPERVSAREAQRYRKNPELYKETAKSWATKNPPKRRSIERRYSSKNPGSKKARTAAYRARLRQSAPPWLSKEQRQQMRKIYAECPKGYCVDHIVPIAGEEVGGLHVPWNLQYLSARENEHKNNSFDPLRDRPLEVGICHQKIRRDQTEAEDRAAGMPFGMTVDSFDLNVEKFTPEHRSFIKRYEWLGVVGFGIRWCFAARHGGLLAGVVLLSEPTAYSSFGKDLEALIQRGAAASWAPKNLNSRLVMFACRWMVSHTAKRLFVAYADPTAGEVGTIYQACNFDYLGTGHGARFVYRLPTGRTVGQRHFTRTSAMKRWAKECGIPWQPDWTKPNGFQDIKRIPVEVRAVLMDYAYFKMGQCEKVYIPSKGKYALLLGVDRRDQRRLNKMKTWRSLPYPKRR